MRPQALTLLIDSPRLPWGYPHWSHPYFMWVHLFDPHRPLAALEPMKKLALRGRAPSELSFSEAQRLAYLA